MRFLHLVWPRPRRRRATRWNVLGDEGGVYLLHRSTLAALAPLVLATVVLGSGPWAATAPVQGAALGYQRLLKLRTTASVLHTTAHPDDEHGGVITRLSRGLGARLGLLTLNRGEGGDNAIGSELFDGLGLIRTEELLLADRYYGVDDQYFTTVVDYGYSKRLDEALGKWGREYVLREVVRAIRLHRPFVVISRFQGTARDGHGQHQAAGLVSREAFRLAGDPAAFPELSLEGLRPWQPFKVYVGGAREDEDWTLAVDAGLHSPWLGETYANFARIGLSFQRSQTSGRIAFSRGPAVSYYQRVESTVAAPDKEEGFFDGIDTTLPGLFKTLGRPAPAEAGGALADLDHEVVSALAAFRIDDPTACVPALARGLLATRRALAASASEPEASFVLRIKEQQLADAMEAALGLDFAAVAESFPSEPAGGTADFAPPATMGAPVPGQTFAVQAQLTNRSGLRLLLREIVLLSGPGFAVEKDPARMATLGAGATARQRFTVRVAKDAPLSSRPYFERAGLQEPRYTLRDPNAILRPVSEPPLVALARYEVEGVSVETRRVVVRREALPPYGYEERELRVVPEVSVRLTPAAAIIPLSAQARRIDLTVELLTNTEGAVEGELALELPAGWTADPARHVFRFARSGERSLHRFGVRAAALEDRGYTVTAVARVGDREFREGYDEVAHRDLETRHLYKRARSDVRGVDVRVPSGLRVGYVMGVGDQVPAGLAQLGATVTLLETEDLRKGDLAPFDAILTGTRAYAVREDLRTSNQRLLDYVKDGGNLIVLYNTPEFVPAQYAPFPAELPQDAEEVSEEDSPVVVLAGAHQAFQWPNKITPGDFDGWVEQRGSKFFSRWDPAYTAMVATHDLGQAPQKGGWLWAKHGKGHYTYFAYALHRQLPYGVPGAYRLLANLLCLGQPQPGGAPR